MNNFAQGFMDTSPYVGIAAILAVLLILHVLTAFLFLIFKKVPATILFLVLNLWWFYTVDLRIWNESLNLNDLENRFGLTIIGFPLLVLATLYMVPVIVKLGSKILR